MRASNGGLTFEIVRWEGAVRSGDVVPRLAMVSLKFRRSPGTK